MRTTVTYENVEAYGEREVLNLPGPLLPVDVTTQPLGVSVWSTTEGILPETGRPYGFIAYGVSLNERQNPPDLTDDEREYIAQVLELAAAAFRRSNPFASPPLGRKVDE